MCWVDFNDCTAHWSFTLTEQTLHSCCPPSQPALSPLNLTGNCAAAPLFNYWLWGKLFLLHAHFYNKTWWSTLTPVPYLLSKADILKRKAKRSWRKRSWPGPTRSMWRSKQTVLFVFLGFRILDFCSGLLVLLRDRWELGLAELVSFGLVQLLGHLIEFIKVELTDDVLLVETQRDLQTYNSRNRKPLWKNYKQNWTDFIISPNSYDAV